MFYNNKRSHARLAQLVERFIYTEDAAGSSPASRTAKFFPYFYPMASHPQFVGILYAFLAVLGWGFGSYFIQKVSRTLGIWKTMFFMSLVGVVGLLPWVLKDLGLL